VNDTVFQPTTPSPPVTLQSSELRDQSLGCTSVTPRGGCCRPFVGSFGTLLLSETTTLSALGLTAPFHASAQ
jgi:hypothetical protein